MKNLAQHPVTNPWMKSTKPKRPQPTPQSVRDDKERRENQTEEQIDKTSQDSFPASDPPARY